MSNSIKQIEHKLRVLDENKLYQASIIFVIIISALTIGAKTYNLSEPIIKLLNIADLAVSVFFGFEITIRFFATSNKKAFFKSGWNIFDTIIVIGSLIPDGGSGILLARLLRVFRVLRLVSLIPELRMLINALIKAIPRMTYIALLMFVIFYIYGAVGSIIFSNINESLWGDVAISMLTLFRIATFEDWTDIMYETMAVHPTSWLFYISFIFLTAFIFLNMMVGTILEVMGEEHERHRAEQHGESLEGGEPASRAQIENLENQIKELKQIIQNSNLA
ncbi:MAG: ion transporter [bacterium]